MRSASAEKCPHGDDGWGEFVRSLAPAADSAARARLRLSPPHPSHPIMRRPDADLEEKREPRVASSGGAQKGDSMKSSVQSLTLAAIEKGSCLAPAPPATVAD